MGTIGSVGVTRGKRIFVFRRVLLFREPGFVREEVVVETSTPNGVGDVTLVGTPIGVDVKTSTHVRVGEVG